MEKLMSALDELKGIYRSCGLSPEPVERLQAEMAHAKVCTPLIGKFSSGKSALVNTLLKYSKKLLREDITPETSVPAEIEYTDAEDQVIVIGNDGGERRLTVDDYRRFTADASTVKKVKIRLCSRSGLLAEIPDVMIVDMPGFESGFEIHNKAIDDYLPQSMAYIVVFPADDMIVRDSVGGILRELCLHEMPICVAITKIDKMNDDFEITLDKLKESLKRYIGGREITYCRTSSFLGDAEDLEIFLKDIQSNSRQLLADKYKRLALPLVEAAETYLKTSLNNSQLSESELAEQEDKLHRQMTGLETRFAAERESFDREISGCVEEIKADVRSALSSAESTLVSMAVNGQDINGRINSVVRTAVTGSVQKRFIPKVEKYSKKLAKAFQDEAIGDIHVAFSCEAIKGESGLISAIVAGAAGFWLGGPVVGIIGGLVAGLVSLMSENKKREEAKQNIRMRLQCDVFPQVIAEAGRGIEQAIARQIENINTSVENELRSQRETLEQAMADLKARMKDEQESKEKRAAELQADLERISVIKDGLR